MFLWQTLLRASKLRASKLAKQKIWWVSYLGFDPFIPNAGFLYPLKTSENLMILWYFKRLGKGYTWNKWVKVSRKKTWFLRMWLKGLRFLGYGSSLSPFTSASFLYNSTLYKKTQTERNAKIWAKHTYSRLRIDRWKKTESIRTLMNI